MPVTKITDEEKKRIEQERNQPQPKRGGTAVNRDPRFVDPQGLSQREKLKAQLEARGATTTEQKQAVASQREQRQAGIELTPEETRQQQIANIPEGTEQQLQEAGVFEQPELTPIISPDQENLDVVFDIAKATFTGLGKQFTLVGRAAEFFQREDRQQQQFISQPEIEVASTQLKNVVTNEISDQLDTQINDAELTIRNELELPQLLPPVTKPSISVAGVAAGAGASVAGGTLIEPLSQFVGSDKTVRNLEASITQLDSISNDIARAVDNGLPPEIAFEKLNRIDEIISATEQRLQEEAIESANVRISLRGRTLEARILSSREKLQTARGQVAQTLIARQTGEEPLTASIAYLEDLNRKYG